MDFTNGEYESRVEILLRDINGESLPYGTPLSRIEQDLQKKLGEDYDLAPILSRIEALISYILETKGDPPIYPMSRIEKILRRYIGDDIEVDPPQSRVEEILIELLDNVPAGLPDGYTEVAGLHLEGARFVLDNFYLTGGDILRFSAKGTASNWIGSFNQSGADDNYSFYASTSSSGKYARYNGQTGGSSIENSNIRYDIEMSPHGVTGTRNPSEFEPTEFTCSIPFCIGATSPTGTASSNVTFYGRIKVVNRLLLIPCIRDLDDVPGWHDGTTFYTSSQGNVSPLDED